MFTNGDAYTTNTISSQNVFFEYFKKEFGRHYNVGVTFHSAPLFLVDGWFVLLFLEPNLKQPKLIADFGGTLSLISMNDNDPLITLRDEKRSYF